MTRGTIAPENVDAVAAEVAAIAKDMIEVHGIPSKDLSVGPAAIWHEGTRIQFKAYQERGGQWKDKWGKRIRADLGKWGRNDHTYFRRKGEGFPTEEIADRFASMIGLQIRQNEYQGRQNVAMAKAERVFDRLLSTWSNRKNSPLGQYGWSEYAKIGIGDFDVYSKVRLLGPDMEPGLELRIDGLTEDQVVTVLELLASV